MQKNFKQAGLTLIELIASLGIFALVAGGALALYNSGKSSQGSTQMLQDLTAIRAATQQIWNGQGSYGTAGTNLNNVLVKSNRIPSTIKVDDSSTPPTLTHSNNGTVTIAAAAIGFTVTLTNIDEELCIPLMTSAKGWTSVKAGSSAAVTSFPISPATAITNCATGTTMEFAGM
jgi:prepilin-type N-terminal cleavage/methylation domain-containing protein